MTPGDLILVTRETNIASWYPGMVVPPVRSTFSTRIAQGTLLLLVSRHATTIVVFSGEHGFVPLYIVDWDGHPSFEVLR